MAHWDTGSSPEVQGVAAVMSELGPIRARAGAPTCLLLSLQTVPVSWQHLSLALPSPLGKSLLAYDQSLLCCCACAGSPPLDLLAALQGPTELERVPGATLFQFGVGQGQNVPDQAIAALQALQRMNAVIAERQAQRFRPGGPGPEYVPHDNPFGLLQRAIAAGRPRPSDSSKSSQEVIHLKDVQDDACSAPPGRKFFVHVHQQPGPVGAQKPRR